MATQQEQRLASTITSIQRRWGSQALFHSTEAPTVPGWIATGFPALDGLLGGGLPRGRITELCGQPTSGVRTLALSAVREAQRDGHLVAYLDLPGTFDAEYAVHCGVDLAHVLLIRPAYPHEALLMLQALSHTGETSLIVLDNIDVISQAPNGTRRLENTLCRLLSPLASTHTTLLCLRKPLAVPDPALPGDALAHLATVRLQLAHTRWLQAQSTLSGFESRVTVLKHKRAAAAPAPTLTIQLPSV